MKNLKPHIIFLSLLLVFVVTFCFLGEIVLPFIIGLLIAYALNPFIKKIQKFIPNRDIAVSLFLVITVVLSTSLVLILGNHIVNDFKRLNNAFVIFADDNSENIDRTSSTIKAYIEKIYPKEDLKKQLDFESKMDSLSVDTETIKESMTKIASFLGSSDDEKENSFLDLNWLLIFIYSIGYFICIVYTYDYFETRFEKYFGREKERKRNKYLDGMARDFNNTFLVYFRQRTKVVVISMFIFITSFLILKIPGAIIFGIIAGLLCYISHFHFLTLIPLSLSCWALSIEQNHSFLLYFGLVFAVFIIVSILEELIFFPKIMKGVSTMNPAIMMISLSLWNYVFGVPGMIIALPLTAVLLIYLDRILMYRKEQAKSLS